MQDVDRPVREQAVQARPCDVRRQRPAFEFRYLHADTCELLHIGILGHPPILRGRVCEAEMSLEALGIEPFDELKRDPLRSAITGADVACEREDSDTGIARAALSHMA